MGTLARPLEIVVGMIALTSIIHLVGLTGLLRLTGHHLRHWRTPWISFDRMVVPLLLVLGLFVVHSLEICAYAFLFQAGEATANWLEALYLSAGAYSTMGFVNLTLSQDWHLVTAWEAMNGMLLTGWSTAFLFQSLDRILIAEEEHPLPESAIAARTAEDSDTPDPR